jgi:hypothetical protein
MTNAAPENPPAPHLSRGEWKPVVVEYEPDSDLRDTEQIPLLDEGGIEAILCRGLPITWRLYCPVLSTSNDMDVPAAETNLFDPGELPATWTR